MSTIAPKSSSKIRVRRRQRARLGRILSYVLTCLICGWLGVRMAYPFVLADRWRVPNDALEREVLQLRLQNQRAEREVKEQDTDTGIMRAARRLGWVAHNEQHLRIPGR